MLRYAGGIVGGFLGALVIRAGLFFLSLGILDTHGDRMLAAWYQIKRDAALQKSSGPRIVFAGGSNVIYGVQATEIAGHFHMPCVNFGTNGGLPIEYQLFNVRKVLKPGDILVLSLEWEYLHRHRNDFNAVFTGQILGRDLRYFWKLDPGDQMRLMLSASFRRITLPIFTTSWASNGIQNIYVESLQGRHIDEWGDFEGNDPELRNKAELARLMPLLEEPCTLEDAKNDTDFWAAIMEFLRWVKNKHVTVVFAAPALFKRPALSNEKFLRIYAEAEKHYARLGIPVIARQVDHFYGEEMMFDTGYHLNSTGRRIRTRKLIEDLAPVVATARVSPR